MVAVAEIYDDAIAGRRTIGKAWYGSNPSIRASRFPTASTTARRERRGSRYRLPAKPRLHESVRALNPLETKHHRASGEPGAGRRQQQFLAALKRPLLSLQR